MIDNKATIEKIIQEIIEDHDKLIDIFPDPMEKTSSYEGAFQPDNYLFFISTEEFSIEKFVSELVKVVRYNSKLGITLQIGVKSSMTPKYEDGCDLGSEPENLDAIYKNLDEVDAKIQNFTSTSKFFNYVSYEGIFDDYHLILFDLEICFDLQKLREEKIRYLDLI